MSDSLSHMSSNNPALQKMFRCDNSTLSLRYLRDKKAVEGLGEFLERGVVRVVNVVEPANTSIFIAILEELARVQNRIEVLHIDLWSNGAPELVDLLANAFRANSESLLELSLKCRFGAKFVADLLPFVPNNIEILDLSENILVDPVFLDPLMDLIKVSELRQLKLMNCSMISDVVRQFVMRLNANQAPISLEGIEGIDVYSCDEIPKIVRNSLRDPPSKTRKEQMGYNCVGPSPQRSAAVQYLDYLKSSLLMHRLEGSRVRVWWPATSDENRSAFAGRFWPAKVLRVNPIDMIFVVEYDNKEVDHVPCRYIQPDSAYNYGGGINPTFLHSLFGNHYFATLSEELASHAYNVSLTTPCAGSSMENDPMAPMMHNTVDQMNYVCHSMNPCKTSYYCAPTTNGAWGGMQIPNGITHVSDASIINGVTSDDPSQSVSDPTGHDGMPSMRSSVGKKRIPTLPMMSGEKAYVPHTRSRSYQSDSMQYQSGDRSGKRNIAGSDADHSGVHNGVVNSGSRALTNGGANVASKRSKQNAQATTPRKDYDFISSMLEELSLACSRRGCDVYFPRDLFHLAADCSVNVETIAGLDVTLSGNVLQVGDICEFRDPLDSEGSDPSDYIGVIQAINVKEPLYKVLCIYQDDEDEVELDSHDVRRMSLIPWYFWVSLVMSAERHALLSKRLCEPSVLQTVMAEFLLCAKKRDPKQPFRDTPPNPLEMPLQSVPEFAAAIKKFPISHPRLSLAYQRRNGETETVEGLRFQLRKQQQKLEALLELYEAVRVELEKERDLNIELQAKLNCVVCFERRVNCLLNPCGHFNFCNVCAESFTNCPICRRKIIRRQVLSVD
ncbi:hypothetical protein X943_002404 [Babesia divergens]|uniref:RING-type domain-containing protein n=1 Tax=Babesia divergens TaxID=32595 RepID=A0AAD9G7F9_BABDI|nr:hypothetical protein X943_002404 [Babesia divergens]